MRETILYAWNHPPDRNGSCFRNFYPAAQTVRFCVAAGSKGHVVKVRVREALPSETPDQYAWWWEPGRRLFREDEPGKFTHVYRAESQVKMSFPDGGESETKAGNGCILPVMVEIIPEEA